MNEVRETLNILKSRWPEVSLLIGLCFLNCLTSLIFSTFPALPPLFLLVTIGISLYALVVGMGFLRTVYLQPNQRRSLAELMQTGKLFFNRLLVISILYCTVVLLFTFVANRIPRYISNPLINLLLAKLIILIPAIIIVTDCSISKSFSIMWKTKLLKAKPLIIFFLIARIVLPVLKTLLFPNIWKEHSSMNWGDAIILSYFVALSVMGLMVSVMAIRFVASLEIPDNNINL